jgi:hypothetical protein
MRLISSHLKVVCFGLYLTAIMAGTSIEAFAKTLGY